MVEVYREAVMVANRDLAVPRAGNMIILMIILI
jgi:hypothetical protein